MGIGGRWGLLRRSLILAWVEQPSPVVSRWRADAVVFHLSLRRSFLAFRRSVCPVHCLTSRKKPLSSIVSKLFHDTFPPFSFFSSLSRNFSRVSRERNVEILLGIERRTKQERSFYRTYICIYMYVHSIFGAHRWNFCCLIREWKFHVRLVKRSINF